MESAVNSQIYDFRFYLYHWLQINLLQPQLCSCIVGPAKETRLNKTSLMYRQCVVTHTVPKSDISALLDSWVTNTRSLKTLCPRKSCWSLCFSETITYALICKVFCLTSNCVSVNLKFIGPCVFLIVE